LRRNRKDTPLLKRSPAFETLIAELSKLPGIGRKSAERIAYSLLKAPPEQASSLAASIRDVKEKIFFCSVCFNLTETDPCPICKDPGRDRGLILVVEDPMDADAFERAGNYRGLYHVLQGRLAPLKGVTPDQLRVRELLDRVKKGKIHEVILATNPDVEGDATALYISRQLAELPVEVSRIGLGLPMGGSLEYADGITLEKALEGRKSIPSPSQAAEK